MRYVFIALLMLWLTACQSPKVNSQTWTKSCGQAYDAAYCVYDTMPDKQDKPTMIWLHGLGDTENVFSTPTSVPSSYPEFIDKFPAAKIIVASYGKGWLLTGYGPRTLKPINSTIENFHDKVLSFIVARHSIGPGPYVLMGHSQGGFNTAQLCAAYPQSWSKCILINPMLIKDSQDPWDMLQICPACIDLKFNYDSKAQWLKDRPSPASNQPPTLVTACKSDIFKLYDGAKEYALKAHAQFIEGKAGCTHWTFSVDEIVRQLK